MAEQPLMEMVTFPSDPARFRGIRDWLTEVARKEGFDERQALDVAVAVNEACANIHLHAYAGREDGEIELRLEVQKEALSLRIRDYGSRFSPEKCRLPDLCNPSESGYGVFLIRALMDEVEYIRKEAGTELLLRKHRRSGCGGWKGDGYVR